MAHIDHIRIGDMLVECAKARSDTGGGGFSKNVFCMLLAEHVFIGV